MPFPSTGLFPSTGRFPSADVVEPPPEPPGAPSLTTHGAVEKLQPGRYMLRHVAPLAPTEVSPGVYAPLGQGFAVLGQTLYADPLPQQRLPSSPDFSEGDYTLRLYDSGEFSLTFPNRDASDGRPWRQRFTSAGHREFIEVAREGEVEFVGIIVKITRDRQKIVVQGFDGLFLLKKAFEQDWTGVIAPRDLIERYSALPVVTFSDSFQSIAASEAKWAVGHTGAGLTGFIVGAMNLTVLASEPGTATATANSSVAANTIDPWSVRAQVLLSTLGAATPVMHLNVVGGTAKVELAVSGTTATFTITSSGATTSIPMASLPVGAHTLLLQFDGRWISAYVDGVLVGVLGGFAPTELPKAQLQISETTALSSLAVQEVICKEIKPFLMRGSEKGDYVLPGGAGTYPSGGLHARYTVSPDTSAAWFQSSLSPDPRRSGFPDFIQSQGVPNTEPAAVPAGVPVNFFSVRYFGAIYLALSKGDYTVQLNRSKAGVAFRAWIGKTNFTDLAIDDWNPLSATAGVPCTVSAAALGGKDGWYPIIVEAAVQLGAVSMSLLFAPPGEYTDPGGTVIKAGGQTVPASSLSPLGCVDARVQGTSFFDLVLETAKNFGYQLRCEPRQLESGEFPGRLIPKPRLGKDYDEILEAGDIDKRSEVNNYTAVEDATDSAGSVKAFGSGIADGKGSQIAFEALSVADEALDLFDMQAWVSAGDIAFPQLLRARAEAELALRIGPWENIDGEPTARDRLADTFPLTGVLSAFHWLPSDGLRLRLPDVGVEDLTPRQIMQVVRNFTPEGRTGTQIGFRARPKDPLYALRTAMREATRSPRAYQHQYVSRVGSQVFAVGLKPGEYTGYSILSLSPQEKVIGATVLISVNQASQPMGAEINSTDRSAALGGPWEFPIPLSILPFAKPNNPATDQRLFVRLKNTGGVETYVEFQLILTLLV